MVFLVFGQITLSPHYVKANHFLLSLPEAEYSAVVVRHGLVIQVVISL